MVQFSSSSNSGRVDNPTSTNRSRVLPALARDAVPTSPRKQIATELFNMFDRDGSGEIELDEIARAFKTTGKLTDETRAQLKAHFDFMDSDGSGEVTIAEFRAALGHGEIDFRNYQHQEAFNSLGLTLCQNLVVYRRHFLHQKFEQMKQSGEGGLQEQFDCLVQALPMSTFALNLKPLPGGHGGAGESKRKWHNARNGPGDNILQTQLIRRDKDELEKLSQRTSKGLKKLPHQRPHPRATRMAPAAGAGPGWH